MLRTATFLFIVKVLLLVPTPLSGEIQTPPCCKSLYLDPCLSCQNLLHLPAPSSFLLLLYWSTSPPYLQGMVPGLVGSKDAEPADKSRLQNSPNLLVFPPTGLTPWNFQQLLPTVPAWLFFSLSAWLHTLRYLFLNKMAEEQVDVENISLPGYIRNNLQTQKCMQNTSWEQTGVPD